MSTGVARSDGESPAVVAAVAAALAVLYSVLTPLHVLMLDGPARAAMVVTAATSAVVLAAVVVIVRRRAVAVAPLAVASVAGIPVLNSVLYLLTTRDVSRTNTLMLSIVGVGALVARRRAAVGLTVAGVGAWLIVVLWGHPRSHSLGSHLAHYGIPLALAVALGAVLSVARQRRELTLRGAHDQLVVQVRTLNAASEALTESEQRYRSVFAASPVGIALANERGEFETANAALCNLLGREESEVLGHSNADFTHPDDLASQRAAQQLLETAPDGIVRIEKRYVRPDGEFRWAWVSLTHTLGPYGQVWTLAHVQDVTERRAADQAVRDSEANLSAVARVMRRIGSGEDARTTIVEAGKELADAAFASLVEPDGTHSLYVSATTTPALADARVSLSATSATVEVFRTGKAMFLADPAEHPLVSPALLQLTGAKSVYIVPVVSTDTVTGVLLVAWSHRVLDIGDRHARAVQLLADEAGVALRQATLLAELEQMATTDSLTVLPNRRGWDQRLEGLLESARRNGRPLTVALADLDHFKAFNDTYGHPAGDEMLREFAGSARTALRAVDIVARWGGEEFAFALPDCPARQAPEVLERVRLSVPMRQTCSIGHATWDTVETAEELMGRADQALYAAKRSGRDRTYPGPSTSADRPRPQLA